MWARKAAAVALFALCACAGRLPEVEHLTPEAALALGTAEGSSLRLREDTRIEGIVFAAGTLVDLGPDLEVERGTLARAQEIAGMRLPSGTEIRFAGGAPRSLFHPSATLDVGELTGAPGSPIALHPDGSVEEICLGEEATVQGLRFPAGTALYLDEDGFAAIVDQPTYFPTGRFVSIQPSARPDCRPRSPEPSETAMLERMADDAAARAAALERCRPLVASGPPRPVVITARLDPAGALEEVETPAELPAPVRACVETALDGLALEGRSADGFTVSILWYLGACRSTAECHEAYVRGLLEAP